MVQALFSVTLVTLSAAAALFVLNLAYTGSHRRVLLRRFQHSDRGLPRPASAGHRSGNFAAQKLRQGPVRRHVWRARCSALYSVLGWLGAPTFYDKLLCVPPLNLLVQPLDRAGAAAGSTVPAS